MKRMRQPIRAICPETFQSDVTRCRCEGEIADVRLRAALALVFSDNRLDLVGGFVKKTQKTPKNELELARQRAKDVR